MIRIVCEAKRAKTQIRSRAKQKLADLFQIIKKNSRRIIFQSSNQYTPIKDQ